MPVWHDPCIDTSLQLTEDAIDTYLDSDGVSIFPYPTTISNAGINFAALDIGTAAIGATGDFMFKTNITVPDLILPEGDGGVHVFYIDLSLNKSPDYLELYYRQGQIASNVWELPNINLSVGSTEVYSEAISLPRTFEWKVTRVGTLLTMYLDGVSIYSGATSDFMIQNISSSWDANACDTYVYDWYAPKINDLLLVWGAGTGNTNARQLLNTCNKVVYFQKTTAT